MVLTILAWRKASERPSLVRIQTEIPGVYEGMALGFPTQDVLALADSELEAFIELPALHLVCRPQV